ncbi:MAG: Holliday junction branch migration protein RuvA [Patescibacteria group bacterium]
MIAQLTGQITYQDDNFVILDVAGVGYKVFITAETLVILKDDDGPIKIWTHLAVRENALDLYGFLEKEELDFFEMLITISGIGPKTALGILKVASVNILITAVSSGDMSYLTKVSGIGQKNAQKIILELKNKIKDIGNGYNMNIKEEVDAIDAMKTLGYSAKESADALQQIDKSITDIGEKIKQAIKLLGK